MFRNRFEAGQLLAEKLYEMQIENPCILGIPRGGIIVAEPIAKKFSTKIEVVAMRKLGHPLNSQVAIGAVMPDGSTTWDKQQDKGIDVSIEYLDRCIAEAYEKVQRKIIKYTGSKQVIDVEGKTVILVDDGINTGYTIRAAISWVKTLGPAEIIVAVPVAPHDGVDQLYAEFEVDEIICLLQPEAVGTLRLYYEDFTKPTDDEVIDILQGFHSK